MEATRRNKCFSFHTDAWQLVVSGTLTHIEGKGYNSAEEEYSANDVELLTAVYFLKPFQSYLEGTGPEVVTDIQFLKHRLSKKKFSLREAR